MVFEPPAPARPRGAPSRTHTFQWFLRAPARPRSPPRRKKGHPPGRTRAYAFWSMSDHANPSYLPSAYTSRTPYKPIYNRCGAKKLARPPCKTLHLPSARRSDREAGRQTTKSRQTPRGPGAANRCGFLEKAAPGAGGLEFELLSPLRLLSWRTQQMIHVRPTSSPRRALGGGGLPLPAAAAAAP